VSKKDYSNDVQVRAQLERILKLRERYLSVDAERSAIGKQSIAEMKKLERLIAGKTE
jgi:hypothetical protein